MLGEQESDRPKKKKVSAAPSWREQRERLLTLSPPRVPNSGESAPATSSSISKPTWTRMRMRRRTREKRVSWLPWVSSAPPLPARNTDGVSRRLHHQQEGTSTAARSGRRPCRRGLRRLRGGRWRCLAPAVGSGGESRKGQGGSSHRGGLPQPVRQGALRHGGDGGVGTQGASHAWRKRPEHLGYQVQGENSRATREEQRGS